MKAQRNIFSRSPFANNVWLCDWAWESACLILALGLVGAIAGILINFNGQTLPELGYSLNLNTLIALLSTALRALIVFVLAEIIGQEKWEWFSHDARPLDHMDQFDEASRGIIGAFGLLRLLRFGFEGSLLAALASLATILSVGIGPFTQQAFHTVACSTTTDTANATAATARFLPGPDGYWSTRTVDAVPIMEPGPRLKAAMMGSFMDSYDKTQSVRYTCPTGNCTFMPPMGTHSTLGLCSKCVDSSHLVKIKPIAQNPNGEKSANVVFDHLQISLAGSRPWLVIGFTEPNLTRHLFEKELAELADPTPLDAPFNRPWSRWDHVVGTYTTLTTSSSPCGTRDGYDCGGDWCYRQPAPNKICTNESDYQAIPLPEGRHFLGETKWSAVATTCMLYPCQQEISMRVVNGVTREAVERTKPMQLVWTDGFPIPHWEAISRPCYAYGKTHPLDDIANLTMFGRRYKLEDVSSTTPYVAFDAGEQEVRVPAVCFQTMGGSYAEAIQSFLNRTIMTGYCRLTADQLSTECGEFWWLSNLFNKKKATFSTISTQFDNLAGAITTFFRNDGWGRYRNISRMTAPKLKSELNPSPTPLEIQSFTTGEVLTTTVCVNVNWLWLLYPSTLSIITIGLLAGTIIRNHRSKVQPAWKTSLLPLLLYGLTHSPQDDMGSCSSNLHTLHKKAKEVEVQFHHGGEGSRLGFAPLTHGSTDEMDNVTDGESLLSLISDERAGPPAPEHIEHYEMDMRPRVPISRKPIASSQLTDLRR